ncbi:hypothetical protein EDD21DRAFT_411005 [Dissophora ornata]|nr:hypothetical protein EDD21DRAFT_411005 [Dissophora ornata]
MLFDTEPPVMAINAVVLLFLPVYAGKLQWPQRHTYMTIFYYAVWVQISVTNIFNAYMETCIVVFLFLCVRYALGKQSTTTLPPADNTRPPSESKKGHSIASDPTASIASREETMPNADLNLETFDSQMFINAWPFKVIAGMIVFVGISALTDSYYFSWEDSFPWSSTKKSPKNMSHTFRTLTTQAYYAIVLTAVQACVILPSEVFKLAWISGYAVLYFVLANLIFFSATQWTKYSTAFRFMYPLWDLLFFTGPHLALALAFVRSLYLIGVQYTSKTAIKTADNDTELRGTLEWHEEDRSVLYGEQHAEAEGSKDTYAVPGNLTISNSTQLDEAEIDIADLSTTLYVVEMPTDIEDHL